MENSLNFLSTREGFNFSLKHFKIVNSLIEDFKKKVNLADLINNAINTNEIRSYQIRAILNAILIDKFGYFSKSYNLKSNVSKERLVEIFNEISSWKAFDVIIAYYHPQLGIIVFNPKNKDHLENISDGLKENELLVIYLGAFENDVDKDFAKEASVGIINLFENRSISKSILDKLKAGNIEYKKIETKQKTAQLVTSNKKEENKEEFKKVSMAKKKLSPQYGVIVTNELFHNGNVEAWKRIIASYEHKYPDTKVLIFYDNEQIHDINSLFKWGKVKHGTMIFFSLLGPEFRNVSKLRRYLTQGASPRFEDFLKGTPGQILNLF